MVQLNDITRETEAFWRDLEMSGFHHKSLTYPLLLSLWILLFLDFKFDACAIKLICAYTVRVKSRPFKCVFH